MRFDLMSDAGFMAMFDLLCADLRSADSVHVLQSTYYMLKGMLLPLIPTEDVLSLREKVDALYSDVCAEVLR